MRAWALVLDPHPTTVKTERGHRAIGILYEVLEREPGTDVLVLLDVGRDVPRGGDPPVRRCGVKWAADNLRLVRRAPRAAAQPRN